MSKFVDRHGKRIEVDEVYPPSRQARSRRRRANGFVMVPLDQAAAVTKALKQPKAMVGLMMLYERWANDGKPFALSNIKLAGYGVSPYAKQRAIEELEAAGLITVDQKPGCAPTVTWVGPLKTFNR
jgi:hypothetical protein